MRHGHLLVEVYHLVLGFWHFILISCWLSNTLVPELDCGSCGNWETCFSEIFKVPRKGMAILARTHQMHFFLQ
jgi:hypothetical protein